MRKLLLVFSGVVAICPCYGQLVRRALFLGNSYTYYNNMPQIVADIADNQGDSLIFDSYTPGGYTLDNHSLDPVSLAKVTITNWDYVILQEQSQLPALDDYLSNGASNLCTLFRNSNVCGRVMFYMTWGHQNGDPLNCPVWPPVCTYSGMDSMLRLNYILMAATNKAELSPVGAAWHYVRNHFPAINLYDTDGSHPSAAGSYLAACCFYAAIFKKDPALAAYDYTLPPAQAAQLRQAAKLIVYDSLAYWTYIPTVPIANFIFTIGNGLNQINCVNNSLDADSYLWDFGDGITSAQKQPTHNYASDGTYTITLTAYNCDLNTVYQSSFQSSVSFCPFTPTITPTGLIQCPGNIDTLWTQNYSSYQWCHADGTPIPNATNQYFPCSGSDSLYVKATQNGCTEASVPVGISSYNNLLVWFIDASGNLTTDTACTGDTVVLYTRFNKPPFPPDSVIDWAINGQPISGYHNDSLLITNGGTYTATVRHPVCGSLNVSQQANYVFINCTAGVATLSNAALISVSPNVSPGIFMLRCETLAHIAIYDLLGRQIINGNYNKGVHNVDLSDYPSGIYILEATDKEHKIIVKLLKE